MSEEEESKQEKIPNQEPLKYSYNIYYIKYLVPSIDNYNFTLPTQQNGNSKIKFYLDKSRNYTELEKIAAIALTELSILK